MLRRVGRLRVRGGAPLPVTAGCVVVVILDFLPAALGVVAHVDRLRDGDREPSGVMPCRLEFGAVELVQLGGCVRVRQEVAAVATGPLGRRGAAAPDPDGRVRVLKGWGSDDRVLELVAASPVGERPGAPGGLQDVDGLVGALAARRTPSRANSSARYPTARPSSSRPPDRTSTTAASSANRSG